MYSLYVSSSRENDALDKDKTVILLFPTITMKKTDPIEHKKIGS